MNLFQLFCVLFSFISATGYKVHVNSALSRTKFSLQGSLVDLVPGTFENEVTTCSKPVLVDFMANWCGPCKLTAPIFKQLAEEMDDVKFVKVDTDIHEDTVDQFNIQGLPLFALFINGKIVATHSGAIAKEPLREFITKNVAKNSA